MTAPDGPPSPSALEALALDLLARARVTGQEGPLADWVAAWAREAGAPVTRVGSSLVCGDLDDPRPLVLLVGHLDVVPPTDDDRVPSLTAEHLVGRGASDMLGGLAVALDCLADARLRDGEHNIVVVAYAGEEGPAEGNELAAVLEAVPALTAAQVAIVLEPTDLRVELGCLGGLHAQVTVPGRAAHSARPWHGDNALVRAGTALQRLGGYPPQPVAVDGLTFWEVLAPTQAWTRGARNVVPDAVTVNVNLRFAPHRTLAEAERHLDALLADLLDPAVLGASAHWAITDRAPPARPAREAPAVAAFLAAARQPVEAKQAWTDVARFDAADVPALNFGPGLVAQAHQRGEHVPRANLASARAALARFLGARSDAPERPAPAPATRRSETAPAPPDDPAGDDPDG